MCRIMLLVQIVTAICAETGRAGNPLLPGCFADPAVAEFDGKYYIYATTDRMGWGGITGPIVCWECGGADSAGCRSQSSYW